MKISISGKTDVGLERADNEDAFAFCPNLVEADWSLAESEGYVKIGHLGSVAVVADGMGGANAGEVASSIAVESVKRDFRPSVLETVVVSEDSIRRFLRLVVSNANDAILKHIETNPDTIGMGTAVVLIWILNERAYVAWCGDCRCYVFNPNYGLRPVSKDHSYVQELIDRGEITIKQSFNHPDSSVITRCLGDCEVSAEPEIVVYDIRKHDQFLLCSDGLCGYCVDKVIERVFYREYLNVTECCNALLDAALAAGGHDNVAVLNISTIDDCEAALPYDFWDRIRDFFKRF